MEREFKNTSLRINTPKNRLLLYRIDQYTSEIVTASESVLVSRKESMNQIMCHCSPFFRTGPTFSQKSLHETAIETMCVCIVLYRVLVLSIRCISLLILSCCVVCFACCVCVCVLCRRV